MKSTSEHLETIAIHAGCDPEKVTGAVSVPIFQTSTYAQSAPGVHHGFEYSRTDNPTRSSLEANLAALEGARYGACFASGCAATDAVLHCLSAGDHVVAGDDLYGGTIRLFSSVHLRHGLEFSFVSAGEVAAYESAIRPETRLIWLETPTNPMLTIADIERICEVGRKHKVPVVVDNTFATPYLQRPLMFGATMVMHSVTKYLGGHSDVVGGAIVTNSSEWNDRIKFVQNSAGAILGPFDAFLVLRGTKTLHVRMERHCENAESIAEFLEGQSQVRRVIYPGRESHPQYGLAKKQMKRGGGMISFSICGGLAESRRFLTGMKIFTLAESLGGVESLIEHPAIMTHASVPKDIRETRGVDDGLIRISVGIEHIDDLKEDLKEALARSAKTV